MILVLIVSWFPAALWAGLVFYLSSLPGDQLPRLLIFPYSDKIGHLIEYAILGALVFRALSITTARFPVNKLVWLSLGLVIFFAVSDEFHQMYVPMREPNLSDLLADSLGAGLGIIIFRFFATKTPRHEG